MSFDINFQPPQKILPPTILLDTLRLLKMLISEKTSLICLLGPQKMPLCLFGTLQSLILWKLPTLYIVLSMMTLLALYPIMSLPGIGELAGTYAQRSRLHLRAKPSSPPLGGFSNHHL